ncbi:uncharacterized protein LOC111305288 isoform X4 [Durio zibethinus]|uniref:Uncharacterized protein LOC111305288 isoform X4 n=1 Tax=Durio zibethinus TaxID=66656 RepID=A0A6P6A0Y9_DURZI|nr:uncharacterized protein LOC111305288 isoform X4 [Durio zibethinus]
MDHDGQRGSSTPSAMLASLLSRRAKLQEELRNIERQVYDMETSYLQDPSQCGNVLKGFEGFLSSSKNTALLKRLLLVEMMGNQIMVLVGLREEVTLPMGSKGKPKKGRAREAKRMRHSSEPDYDDDPDVTL